MDAMNVCNAIGNGVIQWNISMDAGTILADWRERMQTGGKRGEMVSVKCGIGCCKGWRGASNRYSIPEPSNGIPYLDTTLAFHALVIYSRFIT